jgi:hypothetical protein
MIPLRSRMPRDLITLRHAVPVLNPVLNEDGTIDKTAAAGTLRTVRTVAQSPGSTDSTTPHVATAERDETVARKGGEAR